MLTDAYPVLLVKVIETAECRMYMVLLRRYREIGFQHVQQNPFTIRINFKMAIRFRHDLISICFFNIEFSMYVDEG